MMLMLLPKELLMTALNSAYDNNLSFLHKYIRKEDPIVLSKPKKQKISVPEKGKRTSDVISIEEVIRRAKIADTDALQKIRTVFKVEVVAI